MINRRRFLGTAGGVAAVAAFSSQSVLPSTAAANQAASDTTATATPPNGFGTVRVEGDRILVDTHTLSAQWHRGFLTSLRSRSSGAEWISVSNTAQDAALELVYRGDEKVRRGDSKFGTSTAHSLSPERAEFVFHGWDGDGVLCIGADAVTGDMLVEPSAYSARPGVRGCRWNLPGLRPDLELVAPFFQGIRLKLDDALLRNSHWEWPFYWEAGLAILQGPTGGGFWLHTQDNQYRYKALHVGTPSNPHQLSLDIEAYGPLDDSRGAGGLAWRINVFDTKWTEPAERYRQWVWQAYHLQTDETARPAWIHDVRFAVSWCPGAPEILDALARRLDPRRVLIHFPDWRTDPYDENYPTYVASESAKSFIAKAHSMGFRVMPHFNAIDMDPSHPAYALVRDFQYRGVDRQDLRGWSWHDGRGLGVPESNASVSRNRDKKVMVKIHPGLTMWRSILSRNILQAAQELGLEAVFIDVTLVSHNLHNCLVEGMTSTEGMNRLIRQVAGLGRGLVVGGEGLNEITMQGQSFAQAHLFKSWQQSIDGLERTGGCDLNQRLFGRLCRTFGYSGLGGRTESEALRMRMHVEHGAIPTVTIRSAKDIDEPNPAVRQMLDLAQ